MITGEGITNNQHELQFPDLRHGVMTPRPDHISANFAVLKAVDRAKRQLSISDKDVEREQKRLAVETALLVQQEVEHWEASIRELESLLQQQQASVDKEDADEVEAVAMNEETVPVVLDDGEEDEEVSPQSFVISSSPSAPVGNVSSQ